MRRRSQVMYPCGNGSAPVKKAGLTGSIPLELLHDPHRLAQIANDMVRLDPPLIRRTPVAGNQQRGSPQPPAQLHIRTLITNDDGASRVESELPRSLQRQSRLGLAAAAIGRRIMRTGVDRID